MSSFFYNFTYYFIMCVYLFKIYKNKNRDEKTKLLKTLFTRGEGEA